jgi:hypothetical protein
LESSLICHKKANDASETLVSPMTVEISPHWHLPLEVNLTTATDSTVQADADSPTLTANIATSARTAEKLVTERRNDQIKSAPHGLVSTIETSFGIVLDRSPSSRPCLVTRSLIKSFIYGFIC